MVEFYSWFTYCFSLSVGVGEIGSALDSWLRGLGSRPGQVIVLYSWAKY